MKITKNAAAALSQPDTRAQIFEMTPERKEKYSAVSGKVIDLLKAETDGPLEAYMILQFCVRAIEASQGIRGGIIVENEDVES